MQARLLVSIVGRLGHRVVIVGLVGRRRCHPPQALDAEHRPDQIHELSSVDLVDHEVHGERERLLAVGQIDGQAKGD